MLNNTEGGFILRRAGESDMRQILEHVESVHGRDTAVYFQRLLDYYPGFHAGDNLIAADEATGRVVSHMCLYQSRCVLSGTELPVGHMGFVGTRPEHRNRGLIRRLNALYEERVWEYSLPLLVIAGIPYFYRTFGYEYAIPLRHMLTMPLQAALAPRGTGAELCRIEKVNADSFGAYLECRQQRNAHLDLYHKLSHQDCAFFTSGVLGEEEALEMYLLRKDGRAVGFFQVTTAWSSLEVRELWLEHRDMLPAVLRFAGELAREWKLPLVLEHPSAPTLAAELETLAGQAFHRPYAWYVRIPSLKRFLEVVGPALEKRLDGSGFRGLTGGVRVGCYREGFELVFEDGRLAEVKELGRDALDNLHASIPPLVVNQLLVGYRTLDELRQIYPDVQYDPTKKQLVEALFPKLRANLTPAV
jgi:predicted N-acetyltransferase YhbS